MASPLPKLRNDLMVSQHETAHGRSFVIKEPLSSNFFRLGEAEYFIVQQLDGRTTPEIVRKRVEEKFEADLPEETFNAFLEQLQKRDLLETENQRKSKR